MRLSICIPVFNNYNLTKACLEDLSFLPDDVEVIICDNGSTDETINLLSLPKDKVPSNFKYIRSEENLGFAKGSNLCYKYAIGEYILFLNNDIRVKANHSNWIDDLIDTAKDGYLIGPTIGMLDSFFNFKREVNHEYKHHTIIDADIKYKTEWKDSDIFYLSGWCLCGKKQILDKLIINNYNGPFTEEFFTYFEDTDLNIRAKLLNIKLATLYLPLQHFGRMTSKKIGLSVLYSSAREKFINKWKMKL